MACSRQKSKSLSGDSFCRRNNRKDENNLGSRFCSHRDAGYGSTSQRGSGSEEARNLNYEGSTTSGARSGRTGATSQLDSGAGTGTGTGTRSGMTGTGTGTGMTGTSGISEGFRGMNLTHQSGVSAFWAFLTRSLLI